MIPQPIIFNLGLKGTYSSVKSQITFTPVAWHCTSSRVMVNGRLGGWIISGVKGILLPLSSSHSSTTRPSRYGILCLAIARRSLS